MWSKDFFVLKPIPRLYGWRFPARLDRKLEGIPAQKLEVEMFGLFMVASVTLVIHVLFFFQDFDDAFKRVQKLGLKSAQESEVVHVLLHCGLHEKQFNPYYAFVMENFCIFHRAYQVSFVFTAECRVHDTLLRSIFAQPLSERLLSSLTFFVFFASLILFGSEYWEKGRTKGQDFIGDA